jgi:hypothetical protein
MNLPKIKGEILSWPRFLLFFICVFTFLNFFRPIEIEDVWWHLKTGEWIVTHLQVPHEDLFPFGRERTPWIFTQWLGSSFLYLVYKFFGFCGLKVFRALFFVGTVLIFFQYAARRVRLPVATALALLLFPALYLRSNLRPDIFNYVFIQIFLINLFRFQDTGDTRLLFLPPIAGIFWSNMHMGSFVYGIFLIGTFLVSNLGSFVFIKMRRAYGGRAFGEKVKALVWTLVFYCASFLVSPYGTEALLYPFKIFLKPDYIHFYIAMNTIEEVAPPLTFFQLHQWYTGLWAAALFFIGLFFLLKKGNKDNRLLHILLFLLSFGMFLRGVRAGTFFALVTAYVIVESLKNTQDLKSFALNRFQKCFWLAAVFVLSLKGVLLYSQTDFKSGHFVRDMSLDVEAVNPRRALTFMGQQGLQGQVLNSDIFGGYIIWSAYPRLRPFSDGRNLERFVRFNQIIREPQKYWAQAEAEFDFKIILLDTRNENTFSLIRCLNRNDWQLAYYDDASVIFVRRNAFHLSKDVLALEDQLKNARLTPAEKEKIKDLSIRGNTNGNGVLSVLYPKHIDVLDEAKTLLKLGFKQEGLKTLLQASDAAPGPEIAGLIRAYS